MEKIFERTAQGVSIGGTIGAIIGAGVTGVAGPIAVPALVALVVSSAVAGGASVGAIGTLDGGGVGAVTGTAETIHDPKKRKTQKKSAERTETQKL